MSLTGLDKDSGAARLPSPLPEDPADALLTEMLAPAPYEVPMKKTKKKNKMKKMFNKDPSKSSHEFEQELLKTIPSSKSTMISKPGESLALKLVWLIFVNITHSSLALNL